MSLFLALATLCEAIACPAEFTWSTPTTIAICLGNTTQCASYAAAYDETCLDTVQAADQQYLSTLTVYVVDADHLLGLQKMTGPTTIDIQGADSRDNELRLGFTGSNPSLKLKSNVPLRIDPSASGNATFDRIDFTEQSAISGCFVYERAENTAIGIRVKSVFARSFDTGIFTYVTTPYSVTAAGQLDLGTAARDLSLSAPEAGVTWIFSNDFYTADDYLLWEGPIEIKGFASDSLVQLTNSGMSVTMKSVVTTYVDYSKRGFLVQRSDGAVMQISCDETFTGAARGDQYLEVRSSRRMKVGLPEATWPDTRNIRLVNDKGLDLIVVAAKAGVYIDTYDFAGLRLYLGVNETSIESIVDHSGSLPENRRQDDHVGNDIRLVAPTADPICVKVKRLEVATTQISNDNGNVTLIVGEMILTGDQYKPSASDVRIVVRKEFRFSNNGIKKTDMEGDKDNYDEELFYRWVNQTSPYGNLEFTENSTIRMGSFDDQKWVVFPNTSVTFPGENYYLTVDYIPDMDGDTLNSSRYYDQVPLLCAEDLDCWKYEVILKDDPYYFDFDAYVEVGDPAEQVCFKPEIFDKSIKCVGLEIHSRKLPKDVYLQYSSLEIGVTNKKWREQLYHGMRVIQFADGTGTGVRSGHSFNFDEANLSNTTMMFQSSGETVVDTTYLTGFKMESLFVNNPSGSATASVSFLNTNLTNCEWPARNVYLDVPIQNGDLHTWNFAALDRISLKKDDYDKASGLCDVVPSIRITDWNPDGLEYVRVQGEGVIWIYHDRQGWGRRVGRRGMSNLTVHHIDKTTYSVFTITREADIEYELIFVFDAIHVPLHLANWTGPYAKQFTLVVDTVQLADEPGELGASFRNIRDISFDVRRTTDIHFTGNFETSTSGITYSDGLSNVTTTFDNFTWNASPDTGLDHRCFDDSWTRTNDCVPTVFSNTTFNVDSYVNKELKMIMKGQVNLPKPVTVVIEAELYSEVSAVTFVATRYENPLLLFGDASSAAGPNSPSTFNLSYSSSTVETADEMLLRQKPVYEEFNYTDPRWRHLVCGAKFDCDAWKTAAQSNQEGVTYNWHDGTFSNLEFRCSNMNLDVPLGNGHRDFVWKAATPIESGTLIDRVCLDFREVIQGGSILSPHEDFHPKGLSAGAIAGIAIACVAVVAVLVIVLVLWGCRRGCFAPEDTCPTL